MLGRTVLVLAAVAIGAAAPLGAQPYQTLGPNRCTGCHDHDRQRLWWETQDGPPPRGHIRALDQLKDPKSQAYLKAVGQSDAYDVNGSCVACHATVYRGAANAGVSCERCHGPSSGYLDLHQVKNSYQRAVAAGLYDTIDKPRTWAKICMGCHVVTDKRLLKAKHPGDRFDLGVKVKPVVHWKAVHLPATLTAAGDLARDEILAAAAKGLETAGGTPPPPMSAVLDAWVITDPRASAVTAAEERALRLLSELLQRGGCQPDMPSIATAEDGRPDPQFSRVQSAVASLALQALACPPSQPPRATP